MNEREALKLALETLETAMSVDKSYNVRNIKAIIAIKEALAQPERTWVWLTDEEIVYLSKTVGNGVINDGRFARAIEAKLREKNCG